MSFNLSFIVAGRRIRRETGLHSDKAAGGKGWHSREIKPKNPNMKKAT
jgi:hypothetical protein